MKLLVAISCVAAPLAYSCVEPIDFNVQGTTRSLVVDGSLTNERKVHYVTLSYSFALDGQTQEPLTNATVWIEENGSLIARLEEAFPGKYQTEPTFSGIPGRFYSLYFTTEDGKGYRSDPQELMAPIPIDSIYGELFEKPADNEKGIQRGVQIFLANHNNLARTSSYRIEYDETFEVKVPFPSEYYWSYVDSMALPRDTSLGTCYVSRSLEQLLIGTTQSQTQNQLTEFPVKFIDRTGPELISKYFIEVRQLTIPQTAYNFYRILNKNNLEAGTFFDSQKGTVVGNVSGENDEKVQGFFEVAGVSGLSRFFETDEFFGNTEAPVQQFCDINRLNDEIRPKILFTVLLEDVGWILQTENIQGIPFHGPDHRLVAILDLGEVEPGPYPPLQVLWQGGTGQRAIIARQECSDCTLYGDISKPEFWEE